MRTYDLAIVGYGPTGMALAALMAQGGHDVIVLERYPGLYNLPRAACFDDEIMRTFQKLDLVEEVAPGTVVQADYDWVNGAGQTLLEMSYDNPARGGWAALYMMYQPHVETVLDRHCKALATVEVRQGVTVDELRADAHGVAIGAVESDGGRLDVRARYAVGADGGTGFVRRVMGNGIFDYAFEENWLVCDFRKRHPLARVPTFRQVCDPAQPIAIVQIGPDHHRFSFMLERDETVESATDEERVWSRVSDYITPDDAQLVRVANYVFRSRIVDDWRDGRLLLAGDAAHEMPPFLAQGMCSGIRDSHNLAWKLDLVLTGRADDAILDSYQLEREPHVRFITEKAIELGRVQTLRDPEAARARDERLIGLRREHRAPEKLVYPALSAGLIALETAHAGAVFPQGRVRSRAGDEGLFDDVVGQGLSLVCRDPEVLATLSRAELAAWWALGGRIALFGAGGEAATGDDARVRFEDLDGTYGAFFASCGCAAAVVRPDWYLYGTATDGAGLRALLADFHGALAAPDLEPVPARRR